MEGGTKGQKEGTKKNKKEEGGNEGREKEGLEQGLVAVSFLWLMLVWSLYWTTAWFVPREAQLQ